MATLLITSWDDGSRESCSVFYSGYLLVDAEPAQVDAFIRGLSDAQAQEFEDEVQEGGNSKLIAALAAAGMTATKPPVQQLCTYDGKVQ